MAKMFKAALYRYLNIKLISFLLMGTVLFGSAIASAQFTGSAISSQVCGLYLAVKSVVFVLGLLLIIAGAAMYAISNIVPGKDKGTFQGYGVGMIIGGIIGVIIALVAPAILGLIVSNSAITACGTAL